MELPTYTNIWKIEKRLYKLYDFRLPMPLPVGQVAAFLAIAIPYMVILTLAGMPFSHSWVWLYVLPPGVLAWLVTRPVLESKRLPELVLSQLRYLSEPRTWCRMAPLAEKDQIFVTARVWRRSSATVPVQADDGQPGGARIAAFDIVAPAGPVVAADTVLAADTALAADTVPAADTAWVPDVAEADSVLADPVPGDPVFADAVLADPVLADLVRADAVLADPVQAADPEPDIPVRPVWPTQPAVASRRTLAASRDTPAAPTDATRVRLRVPGSAAPAAHAPLPHTPEPATVTPAGDDVQPRPAAPAEISAQQVSARASVPASAALVPEASIPAPASVPVPPSVSLEPSVPTPVQPRPSRRPAVTIRSDGNQAHPPPVIERALRNSPADRAGWHDRVVVVPGGHRPGKPDQQQRDQARARLPLPGRARIVVLGCTAGAGQTTTTLLTGQLLATLRGEAVAVVDIGSGPGSLTEQARQIPRLLPSHRDAGTAGPSAGHDKGLQVVTADAPADEAGDAGTVIDAVVARYQITIADPAPAHVPRAVPVADQLVLVAPASSDAVGALAMTLEWLEAHGHAGLAGNAVIVLNGVSARSAAHVDKAASVAAGRCRALVQVPWDARLAAGGALGTAAIHAYTALAGVLIAGLADPAIAHDAPVQSGRR